MRANLTTLVCVVLGVVLGVGLACDDAPSPPPAPSIVESAAGDLIALLPRSTLVAVELRNVGGRWDELRAIPRLARLQDRILEELGVATDDIPAIVGRRAVLALVADERSYETAFVAVLDPASPQVALARLAASGKLAVVWERGAVWVGPPSRARLLERAAAGDGTSLRLAVDFGELDARLPEGGLARVVFHPRALREYLGVRAELAGSSLAGTLAAFFRSDLEAVEVLGFRRDVVAGQIVTNGWIGFDREVIPEAVTRALASSRPPAALPGNLPGDVLFVSSFRTEAEASLAWLRTMAARDPRGPLRNFDFWVDEFEARTGRSVERDIVETLGERGLALVLEGEEAGAIEFVAVFQARDPASLEAALVDLRDWLAEQVWGRSLGLAIPRSRDIGEPGGIVHGIEFRSPFATFSGPVFQRAGDHIVIATSGRSLDLGVQLALSADSWQTPAWALEDGGPPDELLSIRGGALAGILAVAATYARGEDLWLFEAIGELLAGSADGRLRVDYEEQGLRIGGRLRIDG
jgi:hypothetical protein